MSTILIPPSSHMVITSSLLHPTELPQHYKEIQYFFFVCVSVWLPLWSWHRSLSGRGAHCTKFWHQLQVLLAAGFSAYDSVGGWAQCRPVLWVNTFHAGTFCVRSLFNLISCHSCTESCWWLILIVKNIWFKTTFKSNVLSRKSQIKITFLIISLIPRLSLCCFSK